MSWKDTITKAKTIEVKEQPKPSGLEIKGYFEKGNKDKSSWVAVLTGGISEKFGFEREFVEATSVQWEGEKGKGTPRGMKVWHLPDGLYQLQIIPKKGEPSERYYGAIADGVLDKLHEEQVKSIIESGVELPERPVTSKEQQELNEELADESAF